MGSRSFFNGHTGREEVWLWQESSEHEVNGRTWTETYWFVTDIDAGGLATKHPTYAAAEADYDARVNTRAKAA